MSSLRILIVDDNDVVLQGIRSLLSSRTEWTVCGEAKDGQEALEKAKDLRPDIVLMDVSMPRMDGIQATRIIRRELPESAVIIVSQNDPSVVAVQAAAVDASGYVDKNELSRDLLPAIEKLAVRKNGQKQPNLKSPDARQKDAELAKQAKLLDFSFNAVILRDEEDRITYWNKAAEELYGWAEAEALGRVTHALLKTEFPEPLDSIFELLRRDGKWQGELTHTRKNGTQLTVLSRWGLTFDPKTNAESIMEANIDVTQAKEAERANSLLAAIVGSSDDAIVSKRLDGVISSWNKAAERMFGYSAAEAVGQHITLIIPPDRRDEETQILQRLRRGERIEHFETIRIRKDGGLLDVSLTISPVKDASGKIIGASKVARDVTDRKRADERLRKSEEQLRTLAGELEKQVHIRTQELEQRNAEVLQQSDQLRELSNRLLQTQDDERRHVARELHDSAGQLIAALSMNLATMAQSTASSQPLGKALEDTQDLVRQLNQEIRTTSYLLHPPLLDESGLSGAIHWYIKGLMERSGLRIEVKIAADFGRLSSEMELALFRIVQECLTNIHRHSGSDTAVVRLSRTTGNVKLEVEDEGKGIPAEKLRGMRAQRSGIGITGMRERVRHFNGTMDIQSNGAGTRISVMLPVPAPEPENILQEAKIAEQIAPR